MSNNILRGIKIEIGSIEHYIDELHKEMTARVDALTKALEEKKKECIHLVERVNHLHAQNDKLKDSHSAALQLLRIAQAERDKLQAILNERTPKEEPHSEESFSMILVATECSCAMCEDHRKGN